MDNSNDRDNQQLNNNSQFERREPDRVIDVTKPKESSSTVSQKASIDTTRVSAYTLKEKQALDRLKSKVGSLDQKENRMSKVKSIVAIILVILLILLAVLFVIFISQKTTTEEMNYNIRISMKIENKSALSIVTDSGKEELREIHPGDTIPISAYVRNSEDYRGDLQDSNSGTPPAIFVRFKIMLILNYQERYDILIPTISDKWYRYDEEEEKKFPNGVTADDNYYYYIGSLAFYQRTELFTAVKFDGKSITCDDGGKYGQIQVIVESIEANMNNITTENLWPTAPKAWILEMSRPQS